MSAALALGYAVFLWWFSTGAIILLDGLPQRTFKWSLLLSSLVTVAAFYGLAVTADSTDTRSVYLAFTSALLAWGWIELSFYTGFVTGLKRPECEKDCSGFAHLMHAIEASLYHEIAILIFGALIYALTLNGANQIGLWTFVVLWWMHQSAKVNVLMGVPNLSEEFLPDHLTFIRSFLRKRPMNVFFPVSVTVSTIVLCLLVQAALAATPESAEASGLWLLSAIMALAVLEHWLLVTPLPSAALWRWSLALRSSSPAFDVEIIAGFLGAGKTTLAQRMIAESDASLPSVILVNDFGTLGVDASLLQSASKMSGYDVIELPNGCICCSLAKDLGSQIEKIALKYAPKRLIIEPSGVADVAALLAVLASPALQRLVSSVRVLTLIDGDRFLSDYARMPDHFEAQVRAATALIINKVDLIGAGQLKTIRASLKALNVSAPQFAVSFANVSMRDLDAVSPQTAGIDAAMSHGSHDAGHDHGLEANLGLTSWSAGLEGSCDPDGLHAVLDAIACGAFGQVERVKGIARSGSGWVRFDVAGGRSSVTAFAPRGVEEMPRVMAIGRRVDEMGLRSAFAACAVASP